MQTGKTDRKRQCADLRKPAILKAFYAVIHAEGFENASVAKVAGKAGVHPSLVIHYFGTKEQMVVELVDDVLKTYAELFRRLPTGGGPRERLDRLLDLVWSREWHEAASFSVVFSFLALSQRNDAVMGRLRKLYGRYRQYLLAQLQYFADAGVIHVAKPEQAVEAFISLSEGSHYFCGFHIAHGAFDDHCQNMIRAAKAMLGAE
jgi:AcrR family transcriptional regulator